MKRTGAALFIFATLSRGIPAYSAPNAQGLVEALRDDDESTAQAAQQMLVTMGSEAVRPLEKVLNDSNFRVRRRAVEVLARLGLQAKHAAPALVQLLTDPQFEVHTAAEQALIHMGDAAVPALSDALKSNQDGLRRVALSTLSRCGPKGVPLLLNLLKKDESSYIRADAAQALGEAPSPGPEVIDGLIRAFDDLEEGVRSAAADALGQQGAAAKAAIGPLLAVAQDDKDALTRKKAADALVRIGPATKDSLAGLIAGLRDPSVEVRRQIIDILGQSSIPFAQVLPVLTSAFLDPDAGIRLKAIQACVTLSGTGAGSLPLIKQALGDASRDIRAAAIEGLGHMKDAPADAVTELSRLHTDSNPVIRQDAIGALTRLGAAGLPGLIQALGDNYSALSDQAANAIIQLGPDAVPSLQALEQGPDPVLKKKAGELLRRIQKKPLRKHV